MVSAFGSPMSPGDDEQLIAIYAAGMQHGIRSAVANGFRDGTAEGHPGWIATADGRTYIADHLIDQMTRDLYVTPDIRATVLAVARGFRAAAATLHETYSTPPTGHEP